MRLGTIGLTVDLTCADPAPSPLWHERAFLLLETHEPWLMLFQAGGELICLEATPSDTDHGSPSRPFTQDGLSHLEVALQIDPEDLVAIE